MQLYTGPYNLLCYHGPEFIWIYNGPGNATRMIARYIPCESCEILISDNTTEKS